MAKFKKRGEEEIKRRPPVDAHKREILMAILIRNEPAFRAMQDLIEPSHFGEFDRGYAVIWQIVRTYYERELMLPDKEFIIGDINELMDINPDLLNDDEHEQLNTFINFAFEPKSFQKPITAETYSNWAIMAGKRFLEDRLTNELQAAVKANNTIVTDLPMFIGKFQERASQVAALSIEQPTSAFSDDWYRRAALNLVPTNIPFFDRYLGGGDAAGETYGLMAPYGAGKTTIAAMLACERAKFFDHCALTKPNDEPCLSFIVSYEARRSEMLSRTMGYTAKIRRDVLEHLQSLEDLSRADALKEYEKRIFSEKIANGDSPGGEFEREQQARRILNNHLVLLDMTGSEKKGTGNGSMNEISLAIAEHCRRRKARCGLVVIDYVGAMVKRYMAAKNQSPDMLRHNIGGAPLDAKSMIADRYNCPVWLLHQLSGTANNYNQITLADHTDAAEAKNFGENLDFAFTMSKPDDINHVALLGCTKHRRQEGRLHTIVKMNGAMNEVFDCSDKWMISTHVRKIILKSENKQIPASVKKALPAPVTSNVDIAEDDNLE